MHLEIDSLKDGTYYVFAQMNWASSEKQFVLTAYGKGDTMFLKDDNKYTKDDILRVAR